MPEECPKALSALRNVPDEWPAAPSKPWSVPEECGTVWTALRNGLWSAFPPARMLPRTTAATPAFFVCSFITGSPFTLLRTRFGSLLLCPVGLALFVEFEAEFGPISLFLRIVARFQGLLLPLDRLFEIAGFGVGCGEGIELVRVLPSG
jgi:hypothetical protein